MCGISGFAHREINNNADEVILRRMNDIQRHRGPDGEGYHMGNGIALAMRRLSIIDLKTGDQPIYNEDRSIVLVCNGEIYNHNRLRKKLQAKGHRFATHSDVEVIIHLYEEYGEHCLQHLRGMFGFALWDNNKKQLFLARDRIGIKPLYIALDEKQTLYFASELKSLLVSEKISRDINPQGFKDLFTFGYILTPRTLFNEINHLRPGHYLLYKEGELSFHKYWGLTFSKKQSLSEQEWTEALREKLDETIKIHLNSDVPVAAWMSAGIDSSTVIALARKHLENPIQTFTLGFEHRHYDELSTQKVLYQYSDFEVPNQTITVTSEHFDLFKKYLWHCENPTTSGVDLVRLLLAQKTSDKHKVVLTGEGADEVFCGYPWYRFEKLCRPFSVLPRSIREMMILGSLGKRWKPWSSNVFLAPRKMDQLRYMNLVGAFEPGLMGRLFTDELYEQSRQEDPGYTTMSDFPEFSDWDALEQIQYMETHSRLPDMITSGLDRISMAHSVEARVPFLDHELVEMASQMPVSLKMKHLKEKYILRKTMAGYLPDEIVNRKKRGLAAPGNEWFRSNLPEFVQDMLSMSAVQKKGYFRPLYVSQLMKDHQNGHNHGRELMAILGVQLWDELFRSNRLSIEGV